jgi:hypothetical protein
MSTSEILQHPEAPVWLTDSIRAAEELLQKKSDRAEESRSILLEGQK